MILSIFIFLVQSAHINPDHITYKYLKQLQNNSLAPYTDQAILWSLAELSAKLEKTATFEEIEFDMSKRISDILERVEVAEHMMRTEMTAVLNDIENTKNKIKEAFMEIRWQIHEGVENMSVTTNDAIFDILNLTNEANNPLDYESIKEIKHQLRETVDAHSPVYHHVLFFSFQVLIISAFLYYRQLIKALKY
ncbi:hypothetical protein TRFO_01063 [Tritrichomonas foetus]|uniref:GOLD domain-containing protein n=1 Tax=Tritrichomonas foetus TaxID=1144522 RepID=A0A1J4KJA9_9EUKA|nr:hypothetical protein TRFO_01063 [Tritrichomonas foetus]|eukprot:OHT11162.1 hypothetical protein TRFO_01063 [Tritrichomonas foetus]